MNDVIVEAKLKGYNCVHCKNIINHGKDCGVKLCKNFMEKYPPHVWLVSVGKYYDDVIQQHFIFRIKSEAIKHLRKHGFKYDKHQDLYLYEDKDNLVKYSQWARLEREFIWG
jgi:hypothetical protein